MRGSAGVMALVLAETVAGGASLLFSGPLWSEVRRGFFRLTGAILVVLAVSAWWSAVVAAVPGEHAGRWSVWLAASTAVATFVWTALMFVRAERAGRSVGILSVPIALATLVAMSGASRLSAPIALFQLAAGAVFLGAVIDGLLLGHWYLTDRGLTRTPINRHAIALLVAVAIEAAAVAAGGFGAVGSSPAFNPLLTVGALAAWIALGMVAVTGTIAVIVRLTLRGTRASAVQAATGFFYLAVVTAFTAQVALMVRYLPG